MSHNGSDRLAVGIDAGTSGIRAIAINVDGETVAKGKAKFTQEDEHRKAPENWLTAMDQAFVQMCAGLDPQAIRAIAVDGTSGTIVPVDDAGHPLAAALMYNDSVDDAEIINAIADAAPPTSAAHGSTSALARALTLKSIPGLKRILHQADWLAGQFSGQFDVSDENNALKTGYDPVIRQWPNWIEQVDMPVELLPRVVAAGTPVGNLTADARARYGLHKDVVIVTGTSDGCASFLATGASEIGDGVSALGTTLTLKMLCDKPIFAPQFGLYSHRIGDQWLAGGASNTGGNVLAHFFDSARIAELSDAIDPETSSGLDYYPLLKSGERFPFNDAEFAPRLSPRPNEDREFLKGLLEGIANIEQLGYARLAELGAPSLKTLRTVGGGANNPVWTKMRQRLLGVPFKPASSQEAAYGTARLALRGAQKAGVI